MTNLTPTPAPKITKQIKDNAGILAALLLQVSKEELKPTTEQWNHMFNVMTTIQNNIQTPSE